MAQKLFSLDIREDVVSGVLLQGTSPVVVSRCGLSVVGEDGLNASIEEVLRYVEPGEAICRVSFGAETFFYRNLQLPFADKRKIEKILPIELEENIAVDIDSLVVDAVVTGDRGRESSVIAAMLEKEFLARQLELLASFGLDPEIVTVSGVQCALQLARQRPQEDFVLLDCGCCRATLFAMLGDRMRLIRTLVFDDGGLAHFGMDRNSQFVSARRNEKKDETFASLAREVRRTLYALDDVDPEVPFLLTGPLAGVPEITKELQAALGNTVELADLTGGAARLQINCGLWRPDLMSGPLALGLRSRKQMGFNFRKGEFVSAISMARYKKLLPRLAIPLVACLIVFIGLAWHDFSKRNAELSELRRQGEAIFRETVPKTTRVVNPVQQLSVAIKEMKNGSLGEVAVQGDLRALDVLAELSTCIPESINVHVLRMVADSDGVLLRGLTDNFNSVDSMKKAIEKSAYFSRVTINSANLAARESGIRFELKLELNKG